MKIAITAQGKDLQSIVDPRFGRCKYFFIYNTEDESFEVKSNEQNLTLPKGAGIQAAQNICQFGVQKLITGNIGPKAHSVLQTANIEIYLQASGSVQEALQAYKEGKLEKVDSANVQGHWI